MNVTYIVLKSYVLDAINMSVIKTLLFISYLNPMTAMRAYGGLTVYSAFNFKYNLVNKASYMICCLCNFLVFMLRIASWAILHPQADKVQNLYNDWVNVHSSRKSKKLSPSRKSY